MARLTKKRLNAMVNDLLALKGFFDRFKALEKEIKQGMIALDVHEVVVQAGRVFITQSERVSVPPEVAEEILGKEAEKVIVIKRSVPNNRLEALKEAGIISEADFEAMWERAERKAVANLYVRPLK